MFLSGSILYFLNHSFPPCWLHGKLMTTLVPTVALVWIGVHVSVGLLDCLLEVPTKQPTSKRCLLTCPAQGTYCAGMAILGTQVLLDHLTPWILALFSLPRAKGGCLDQWTHILTVVWFKDRSVSLSHLEFERFHARAIIGQTMGLLYIYINLISSLLLEKAEDYYFDSYMEAYHLMNEVCFQK